MVKVISRMKRKNLETNIVRKINQRKDSVENYEDRRMIRSEKEKKMMIKFAAVQR